MKSALLFLVIVTFGSQLFAETPAQQFLAGKTKFSTAGHPKSKGISMTIEYPTTWTAKEGERPNIVQKFTSPGGQEMVGIMTKSIPIPAGTKITEDELKEFFTPDEMKSLLPEVATFISAKPTKIEGLPAGILEYSMRQERAGLSIDMQVVAFIFIHEATMVQVLCSVGGGSDQAASFPKRMAEFMPLFTLMANSIVLPDRWK